MGRALLVLSRPAIRERATRWIAKAPEMTRVTFQGPKRTLPQNALLWSALTDVASQVRWHNVWLEAEDWKTVFMSALKQELRIAPGLNGGFVNLGVRSSALSKEEMTDLLELIFAFGSQPEHPVIWTIGPDADPLRALEAA